MTTLANWQKSSFSGGGVGNDCVELASTGTHIHLRESDTPTEEVRTSPTALIGLLRTLKAVSERGAPRTRPTRLREREA
ncbi:DUF397 domain-containing protein [Streptomyces sp. NPDC046465]|uniref:DUF397 domain-containing protein n=1 Tax=Streptomyces sp. NPDC046465 TaxID=3155810 RepID=UPI0033D49FC7